MNEVIGEGPYERQ